MRNWDKELARAVRELAHNKARIESASPSGTASHYTLRRRSYVPAPGGGGFKLAKGAFTS